MFTKEIYRDFYAVTRMWCGSEENYKMFDKPELAFIQQFMVHTDIEDFIVERTVEEFHRRMEMFNPLTEDAWDYLKETVLETLLQGLTFFKPDSLYSSISDILCGEDEEIYVYSHYDEEKDEFTEILFDFSEADFDATFYIDNEKLGRLTLHDIDPNARERVKEKCRETVKKRFTFNCKS